MRTHEEQALPESGPPTAMDLFLGTGFGWKPDLDPTKFPPPDPDGAFNLVEAFNKGAKISEPPTPPHAQLSRGFPNATSRYNRGGP